MAKVRATLARLQTGIQLDLRKAVSASTFGVNEKICPDFLYAVTLVGDLKTGPNPEFYDGVATGYAIFAEYALERRINTAAILSIDLDVTAGIVRSHTIRIIHPDDDLRMHWVTQRDTALRIFAMPNEPQHPEDTLICNDCTFRSICWVDGVVGGTPILDGQPVAPLPGA
jgi:CRISPR/Cas system-associated exonuclease Cas4 (RecB family)